MRPHYLQSRRVFARELNRPVYAIDLRNHGDSSHDPRHNYTALAEDVEGFLQKRNIKDSTLIGHSMGAKTAMAVALRKNVPISSLISVDNAPVDAALHSAFAKYTQGMKRIEDAQLKKQSEADAILKEYEESLPVRQFLLTNLMRGPDGIMKWRVPIKILTDSLNNMADFPFTDPEAARWEGPALFVRGTKSHYVADEMLPTIGRFFPRFQLSDVDCGHWVISEKPEDFRKGEPFLFLSYGVVNHLLTNTSSCCRLPPGPRVDYPIVCDVLTIDLDFTTCTVIIILVHNSLLDSALSVDYIDRSLFFHFQQKNVSLAR
jgi:pimeloyl-ACP methyl ester carboxylesterase